MNTNTFQRAWLFPFSLSRTLFYVIDPCKGVLMKAVPAGGEGSGARCGQDGGAGLQPL